MLLLVACAGRCHPSVTAAAVAVVTKPASRARRFVVDAPTGVAARPVGISIPDRPYATEDDQHRVRAKVTWKKRILALTGNEVVSERNFC